MKEMKLCLVSIFIQENSRQLKPPAGLTSQKQINASKAYKEFSSLALLSWYVF